MIKYRENRVDIIQCVEINLTEIPDESKITKYLEHIDTKHKNIYKYVSNKLVYETEVLLPKADRNRPSILMVLGNPAIHSVAERMFFSYERTRTEGKWREHRFWRALRDCDILKFNRNTENPTPKNIEKINDYKRDCLLNGTYESDFNIFLLPYFSFPTPASGKYSGVGGIVKIFGRKLFTKMKEDEFQRFKWIVLSNDIKNVICFHKGVRKNILEFTTDVPFRGARQIREYMTT
ncbi:MAG: hypothetical protein AAGB97_09980 [Dehalococcoidia bacterium]|nr:hypothetical protein [Chloroflexota bacterium]